MYLQVTMTTAQPIPPKKRSDERRQDSPNAWLGRMFAASSLMIGLTAFGLGVGYLIDSRHGTSHRWVVILGVTGVLLGLYQIVRMGNRP